VYFYKGGLAVLLQKSLGLQAATFTLIEQQLLVIRQHLDPCHPRIIYHCYLRFLPNGTVVSLLTSDKLLHMRSSNSQSIFGDEGLSTLREATTTRVHPLERSRHSRTWISSDSCPTVCCQFSCWPVSASDDIPFPLGTSHDPKTANSRKGDSTLLAIQTTPTLLNTPSSLYQVLWSSPLYLEGQRRNCWAKFGVG